MTPSEAIGRADEAKRELALTSEAFQAIREACLDRMRKVSREGTIQTDALQLLAMTINIADDVEAALQTYIAAGKVAEDQLASERRREQMSPTQRRYADAL